MGTPNREPQEYTRNIIEYKDPGRHIPTIFLNPKPNSWGFVFGVPSKVPFKKTRRAGLSWMRSSRSAKR